jgi:hypothetical protein
MLPDRGSSCHFTDAPTSSYCGKINPVKDKDKDKNDTFADVTLRRCQPQDIKAYLEWRVDKFQIKKESTLKSYWKRLSCGYIDLTGRRIDNGTELDIRDVCLILTVLASPPY